jgi:uncharacterized protein DUF4388/PilZ domain-containing protein
MKKKDRRTSKRISYVCEVECEGAGLSLATRINDLSTSGAFIDSLTCYAPGTYLRLRFRINDTLIEAGAEVRFTMPQMGMGVRFLGLESAHLSALENLIEGAPPGQPPAAAEQPKASAGGHDSWKTPDTLLGNFAIVSMFDVIQLIENNRLSGMLMVFSPLVSGEIYFNDGRIVGAHSGKTGIEALKRLLNVSEGSFEFKRSDAQYPSTIQASSNMSLMLELLRVIDEEAHGVRA